MNKIEWQLHYGFTDEDMTLIDLALSYGERITAIFNKPLEYEIMRFNS